MVKIGSYVRLCANVSPAFPFTTPFAPFVQLCIHKNTVDYTAAYSTGAQDSIFGEQHNEQHSYDGKLVGAFKSTMR